MKRLIITVGISGSGKSTWAHKMFEADPLNVRIINRDKIRELLFGYTEENISDYYLRRDLNALEKEVTKQEDILIDGFLSADKIVIVDATHLKRAYLERFKYWNVTTELKVFQIQLNDAVDRVTKRKRKLSKSILEKQDRQFKSLMADLNSRPINYESYTIENNEKLPPCVIFDIDGTLAHKGKRNAYDWKSVGKDTVDESTAYILRSLEEYSKRMSGTALMEKPPEIIICTGRDGVCLPETIEWLSENDLYYRSIFIREEKDCRADWIVKEEFWHKIAKRYNIIGMFDDRMQVVRRARALGLKVFNVENNNF